MKLQMDSAHYVFTLLVITVANEVGDRFLGMAKVKNETVFFIHFNSLALDMYYAISLAISSILFWRFPWRFGFRKILMVSLVFRIIVHVIFT